MDTRLAFKDNLPANLKNLRFFGLTVISNTSSHALLVEINDYNTYNFFDSNIGIYENIDNCELKYLIAREYDSRKKIGCENIKFEIYDVVKTIRILLRSIKTRNFSYQFKLSIAQARFLFDSFNFNINHINIFGSTSLSIEIEAGNFETAEYLIKKGADVNLPNKFGETPLYLAVIGKDFEMIKLLIANGADVNLPDKCGETPLHLAVIGKDFEMIKLLIANGADVNLPDKYDKTPFYCAIDWKDFEMIKLLIANGADVNHTDKYGKTPFYCAIEENDLKLAQFLLDNGANISPIKKSINLIALVNPWCKIKTLEFLITKGATFNKSNFKTEIRFNRKDFLTLMLENRNVNIDLGYLVNYAVEMNKFNALQVLLENGAVINNGLGLIESATSKGFDDIAQLLKKSLGILPEASEVELNGMLNATKPTHGRLDAFLSSAYNFHTFKGTVIVGSIIAIILGVIINSLNSNYNEFSFTL